MPIHPAGTGQGQIRAARKAVAVPIPVNLKPGQCRPCKMHVIGRSLHSDGTPSLDGVPRVGSPAQRYYEVLRLPAAHFAAIRFLRLAIPSLRPLFVPPAPDAEPWINLELVGGISSRLGSMETTGSPKFPEEPL